MIKKNLELLSRDGTRTPFSIEIGEPFEDEGSWRCPVNMPGLSDFSHKGICGEDSVQSICLALGFVKRMLEYELEKGSTLLEADSDEEWPIDVIMKL